jgi:DNA-binding NarL/FixJ family response regulator
MIRVLIVDDQALVRDGESALAAIDRTGPDLVPMDIRMPGMDGLEATRRLIRRNNAPGVLVLTTYDADANVVEAMRAGASGFLLKDSGVLSIRHPPPV